MADEEHEQARYQAKLEELEQQRNSLPNRSEQEGLTEAEKESISHQRKKLTNLIYHYKGQLDPVRRQQNKKRSAKGSLNYRNKQKQEEKANTMVGSLCCITILLTLCAASIHASMSPRILTGHDEKNHLA